MASLSAMAGIGRIEAGAGADVGFDSGSDAYSGYDTGGGDDQAITKRAVIIWVASAVWLAFVWRAVQGY